MDPITWTAKVWGPARTYIPQVWADTGYSLEDLLGAMAKETGGERGSGRSVLVVQRDKDKIDGNQNWYL